MSVPSPSPSLPQPSAKLSLHGLPTDYSCFLEPNFDPQSFANSLLSNHNQNHHLPSFLSNISRSDSVPSTSDPHHLTTALSNLNLAIEQVNKQLRTDVSAHHLKLLSKSTSIASLYRSLQSIQGALLQIDTNADRLQTKIGLRYHSLETALNRLDRYQSAAELCRRAARFVSLAKRLDTQMSDFDKLSNVITHQKAGTLLNTISSQTSHASTVTSTQHKSDDRTNGGVSQKSDERELALAEAALTLSELESLLTSDQRDAGTGPSSPSIRSLRAVDFHVRAIHAARQKVESEMSKMLATGLVQLDRSLLASSFQTAFNLSILAPSVASLVLDLTEVVKSRVRLAFDINALAKQAGVQDPAPSSSFMYKSRARTEPTSATVPQWTNLLWSRLEALIDDLTSCCVKVYTLEKVLEWKKEPISGISFLDEVMNKATNLDAPPRTVFWTTLSSALEKEAREASRGSNFINQTLTSAYPRLLRLFHDFFSRISLHTATTYNIPTQSPETVLTLRAIAPFEAVYLGRSATRIVEAVNGKSDKIGPILGNELDAARFDPLLLRSVARKMKEVIENHLSRTEDRIVKDYQSTSLAGPIATPSQVANLELANMLSDLTEFLSHVLPDYPDEIQGLLSSPLHHAQHVQHVILRPLTTAIQRELTGLVGKMHTGRASTSNAYMTELTNKLSFVKAELVNRLKAEPHTELLIELTRHLITTFLLHATLVSPLHEPAKLKLTAELAQLEFGISQFVEALEGLEAVELELEGLRRFRQMIFAEGTSLEELVKESSVHQRNGLDQLVVIQHLLVRAQTEAPESVKLLHERHGWSEVEYGRWIEEHPSWEDRGQLFEELLLEHQDGQSTWIRLVKTILNEARQV